MAGFCQGQGRWALAAALVGAATASAWAQTVEIGSAPPSPHGRIIRQIRVERVPIFTEDDRAALPWLPLGLVNRAHVDTREAVIRRELIMEPGQPYDAAAVAESERKLRDFGIFAAAEIVTIPVGPDSVDVLVRTRELWTTAMNFAYESFDGDRLWTVELREKNFLGTARGVTFARREDVDRATTELGLSDRQLFGTRWRGRARWRNSDDGSALDWSVAKPFFDTRDLWALDLRLRDQRRAPRYYLTPDEFVRPDLDETFVLARFDRRWRIDDRRVWRLGGGVSFERQDFDPQGPLLVSDARGETLVSTQFPVDPAENRTWTTLFASAQRATRDWGVYRYLFAMGTAEDIPFGPQLDLRVGWTTRAFGSSDSGLRFQFEGDWFTRLSDHWLQRIRWSSSGLVDVDESRDVTMRVSLSEYHQPLAGVTLAGGVLFGAASGLDRHDVFSLGVDSGLRASRYRQVAGDRLFRANTEARFVYTPGWRRLVTPGVAFFADYGTAWFEQGEDFRWELVRGAVGFGLRLGFNRASSDVPIRIDLAWPVLYPTDQESPVLSIGTGHVF